MKSILIRVIAFVILINLQNIYGQDATSPTAKSNKPVKHTFEDGNIINSQSVEILRKNALEFIIRHRLGKMDNMFEDGQNFDFFGVFAPANIQIGLNFGLTKKLTVGVGGVKNSNGYYVQAKYKVFHQTKSNSIPASVAIFCNAENNVTKDTKYSKYAYRLSYFCQLLIARKFSRAFSLQLAPSYTHFNFVDREYITATEVVSDLHDNVSLTADVRYNFSPQGSILVEYTHSFMESKKIERQPDLGLGLEISTGSHTFQVIIGTATGLSNQQVTNYNTNDFTKGDILIGFNITRRWNF